MSQVLDLAHRRRLLLEGIWEETPTLEEALGVSAASAPDPAAPAWAAPAKSTAGYRR